MKMRSMAMVLATIGAIGALAFAPACSSSGGGGAGGGAGGGSGGSANGGAGGGGSCADSCAAAITDNEDICASSSGKDAFDTLQSCASSDATCGSDCSNFVMNGVMDSTCSSCLQSSTTCGTDFTDCSNN